MNIFPVDITNNDIINIKVQFTFDLNNTVIGCSLTCKSKVRGLIIKSKLYLMFP